MMPGEKEIEVEVADESEFAADLASADDGDGEEIADAGDVGDAFLDLGDEDDPTPQGEEETPFEDDDIEDPEV